MFSGTVGILMTDETWTDCWHDLVIAMTRASGSVPKKRMGVEWTQRPVAEPFAHVVVEGRGGGAYRRRIMELKEEYEAAGTNFVIVNSAADIMGKDLNTIFGVEKPAAIVVDELSELKEEAAKAQEKAEELSELVELSENIGSFAEKSEEPKAIKDTMGEALQSMERDFDPDSEPLKPPTAASKKSNPKKKVRKPVGRPRKDGRPSGSGKKD